jgi:D-tyrosyl-tRNA(Tyr) deacylase
MKAVIQRVKKASVSVDGEVIGSIGPGILVLLGVGHGDTEKDADWLLAKIVGLRIFRDAEGKMNLSLSDIEGDLAVVSQFTLLGDCRKGRRPSFVRAAEPGLAEELYEYFIKKARELVPNVGCGRFAAMMDVSLINDGPVTLILDSPSS